MIITSTPISKVERVLDSNGLVPFEPGELSDAELYEWISRPREPIWVSEEPLLRQIICAAIEREQTSFLYLRGPGPARLRTISPDLVFSVKGSDDVFVSGYCHHADEHRVFCFSRMLAATTLS